MSHGKSLGRHNVKSDWFYICALYLALRSLTRRNKHTYIHIYTYIQVVNAAAWALQLGDQSQCVTHSVDTQI